MSPGGQVFFLRTPWLTWRNKPWLAYSLGPDSFQWCPVTAQGATGTNWSTESSIWTWGRTSLLWGWWSTAIGCPEGLWSLLLWRYSKPTRTRSCATCSRWPCFGRELGLHELQRSLPTPGICDSVIYPFPVILFRGCFLGMVQHWLLCLPQLTSMTMSYCPVF